MGGGKSSGSSSAVLTPEQTEQLKAQTDFLKNTLMPAYKNTVAGAQANYEGIILLWGRWRSNVDGRKNR